MPPIGYLVPEFPGQTHNFFWREIQSLRSLGARVRLLSTRRPPMGVMSTSWGPGVESETVYLFPFAGAEFLGACWTLLTAGPAAWLRCVQKIAQADGVSFKQRVRMLGLVLMAARLVKIAAREGWRHVHVHSCADAANVALFANSLSSLTYSMTLHTALASAGGNQRQKWRHAAFGIVITQGLLDEVRTKLSGSLPPRIEIAPMGVDVSVFARTVAFSPYEGSGELRVFCCGRLNRGKGHRFLIEAVHQLRRAGLPIVLNIAGEDDIGGKGHRLELEALIRSLGLQEQVHLLGAIPEEAVRRYLQESHVFALASLDEALGVAIMEAMSMEVPVVAVRTGGVPELVSSGVEGLLVDPGDASAIANAITVIASDPQLARRMGQAARLKITDNYSTDRSAKAIIRLLESLHGGSGLAAGDGGP